MADSTAPPSETAGSENVAAEEGGEEAPPPPPSFPPYPPYALEAAPPSVADTIMAGRDIRVYHKAGLPRKPVRPAPRPARPRGPKATDVKLTKRAMRAHARCLRRHNAVLTDRLEFMSKPHKRRIICLWREHGDMLPADTVARLRTMLDADEPFKPDQAYEYFINLRKTRKRDRDLRVNEIKKDVVAMCADKRFVWARNATVAFARGIQQRLSRPGRYALADGMLRLSNIVMNEICEYMHMRPPSRRCTHPRAKFMMEMSDKVAIWIDEIISESEDRMLMMDFDEDDDVERSFEDEERESEAVDAVDTKPASATPSAESSMPGTPVTEPGTPQPDSPATGTPAPGTPVPGTPVPGTPAPAPSAPSSAPASVSLSPGILSADVVNADEYGDGPGFTDNFLNMMGGAGGAAGEQAPAYTKLTGEEADAFKKLTDEMHKKGRASFVNHVRFKQNFNAAAEQLKKAPELKMQAANQPLAQELHKTLMDTVTPATPAHLAPAMEKMVGHSANYLAQHAEFNKHKGEAFHKLVKDMKEKGNEPLYNTENNTKRTYAEAAKELEESHNGLETSHDDPNLSQEINSKLNQSVEKTTPDPLKDEMKDTVDIASKFLSENAVNESIRAAGGVVTEEGFYIDEHGVKRKINPEDSDDDFYVDENGIRRKKKPGEETYVDANGVRRKGKDPGAGGMAAPKTEKGYYVDENGVKKKIEPGTSDDDFYVDENGIRRKKKPGEETYVDANGVRRKGKAPGAGGMAAPKTEEGYYVDENGVKKKIEPGMSDDDFYIDENGIRRKKKPGEETYVDANGIRRKGKPPGGKASAGAKGGATEDGYYIDEHGNKKKIGPGDNPDDYYIDAQGNRKKRQAGGGDEDVDEHGVRKKRKKQGGKEDTEGSDDEHDPERSAAVDILHKELGAKGGAPLYKQPHTELSHSEASKWLKERPRRKVEKTVKESADTARLHKKFERKLGELVAKKTPAQLQDTMQDVVIESSRILSEYFVSSNYKALVRDGLISEMQKKGNEILVEVGDTPETFFFAAQRLKKADNLEPKEPCDRISYFLTKQLDDMIRCRTMARKVIGTMKEHIKVASEYLSEHVTKPDEQIEAYVALLGEMEATGDALLIEGNIPKSYKSCAAYLRTLTSFDDQINRSDGALKSATESKLKSIMANVEPHGYSADVLNRVISQSAGLLVSYIMLQGEKTEALNVLVEQLTEAGPVVLLRHGTIRKTYTDGADLLRGKNADQLGVTGADPVVARKVQLKLVGLMHERTPDKFKPLMNDVIEEATMYLANYLLQPRMIQVCKCMKNVFVQCELWCDEILRRVARPCCTCSRHVSAQALAELAPGATLHFAPGSTRAFVPGLEVSVTRCPSAARAGANAPAPCPAARPTPGCNTAAYMLYSTSYSQRRRYSSAPSPPSPPSSPPDPITSYVAMYSASFEHRRVAAPPPPQWLSAAALGAERHREPQRDSGSELESCAPRVDSDSELEAHRSLGSANSEEPYMRAPPLSAATRLPRPSTPETGMRVSHAFSRCISCPHSPLYPRSLGSSRLGASPRISSLRSTSIHRRSSFPRSPSRSPNLLSSPCSSTSPSPVIPPSPSYLQRPSFQYSPSTGTTTRRHVQSRNEYGARNPIVSTDQMSDWHAMMVSLMWNVQAWRDWIQENIDRALSYQPDPTITTAEANESWANFQRRVATEALQWRQYNLFSRQLTLRLALRYKDKHIVSPTRVTNRTETYTECQEEMLEIIEMFNRWTQWLSAIVKESNSLSNVETNIPLHELRWQNFKMKVVEYSEEWDKYNLHLKVCWEQKYRTIIAEWLPEWKQPGPVWVVSACGAVPSGAVAAGIYDSEVVWVARTTHRCNVLPGALHPSKHCCIVYADGAVHHYTKYQVMCNAKAVWMPWRAGAVGARAVRVAPGVHAGRVLYRGAHLVGAVHAPHYRCHVVIFGRPFAFNCYELLVLPDED